MAGLLLMLFLSLTLCLQQGQHSFIQPDTHPTSAIQINQNPGINNATQFIQADKALNIVNQFIQADKAPNPVKQTSQNTGINNATYFIQ